jgi:hypothetical protein
LRKSGRTYKIAAGDIRSTGVGRQRAAAMGSWRAAKPLRQKGISATAGGFASTVSAAKIRRPKFACFAPANFGIEGRWQLVEV